MMTNAIFALLAWGGFNLCLVLNRNRIITTRERAENIKRRLRL